MNREKHAKHNEDLCQHLIENTTGYNDWIVTTAFYSSIHYVEHKLFPLKISGAEYTTFEHYYVHINMSGSTISKHKLKIELVKTHLRHVWSRYKRLHDVCRTARYIDYIISDDVATQAARDLRDVKKACIE